MVPVPEKQISLRKWSGGSAQVHFRGNIVHMRTLSEGKQLSHHVLRQTSTPQLRLLLFFLR